MMERSLFHFFLKEIRHSVHCRDGMLFDEVSAITLCIGVA